MEPYLGEIRLFAFDKIPTGWLPCEGQLLSIQQNAALYSLLGTTYGGDGMTNFKLPDLRGRVPLQFNSQFPLGASAGEANHTLTAYEMPMHTHMVNASSAAATSANIAGNVWAQEANTYAQPTAAVAMSAAAISLTGGNQAHPNMQPYMTANFCIAIQGIYPSRN